MLKRKQNFELDEYEQELSDSLDRDEWKSVDNLEEIIILSKQAAQNYFKKDKRITIRINSVDLMHLKIKAALEGLPYQTLVASVLHKYASGHPD
jgi:predicted DNA binding CopG/RHH family protein